MPNAKGMVRVSLNAMVWAISLWPAGPRTDVERGDAGESPPRATVPLGRGPARRRRA